MGEFCHNTEALWRNGSASDSRSEGCVFKSRQGHLLICVDHTLSCERQLVIFGRIEDCSRWGANSQHWHCSAGVPRIYQLPQWSTPTTSLFRHWNLLAHKPPQTSKPRLSHNIVWTTRYESCGYQVMQWPRGATVARLTPDQKVACSNHVGVITLPTVHI